MRLLGHAAALAFAALCLARCGTGVVTAEPDAGPACGNGVVEGTEECDQGSANGPGHACLADCTWSCIPGDAVRGDHHCNPSDPCKGHGFCGLDHKCQVLDPKQTGDSCGADGHICKDGACIPAVCGDGIVTAPEECDDGKNDGSAGCGADCRWSCVPGDATRDCAPADSCKGQGACNGATHQCSAGTPLPNGTACGAGGHCSAGNCVGTNSVCGNGIVEPGEDCDFGNANGAGTGCETNCKFSCTTGPDSCPQGDVCSGGAACHAVTVSGHAGQRCVAGTPLADNTSCGGGNICHGGVCSAPPPSGCGNGVLDPGEDCDFGSAHNGPGTGCEWNCKFSCTTGPDSCPQGDPCQGPNTCTAVTGAGTGHGQRCKLGAAPAACAPCGDAAVCVLGHCRTSVCGDGCVDERRGETCEPPGAGTCDAQCHSAPACGNGVLDPGEDCDDGNLVNLDGCDSHCKLEVSHRATSLALPMGNQATSSYCTANAIGSAIATAAQSRIKGSLDTGVTDGTVTMAFQFLGLTDLTGSGSQSFQIGGLAGNPYAATNGATYSGNSDLDWWYSTDISNLDSNRKPTAVIAAQLASKAFNTPAPGNLTLNLALGGSVASVRLSTVKVRGNLGGTSKPTHSSNGSAPGHTAQEHVNPQLTTVDSMSNGELCGNISAASLAAMALPAAISSANCSPSYSTSNHMLDVLVSGCTAYGLFSAIYSTQPDQVDPSAPAVGAGGPYRFTTSGTTVTGCNDKHGTGVDLQKCLAAAAYSVYFTFAADRVIMK